MSFLDALLQNEELLNLSIFLVDFYFHLKLLNFSLKFFILFCYLFYSIWVVQWEVLIIFKKNWIFLFFNEYLCLQILVLFYAIYWYFSRIITRFFNNIYLRIEFFNQDYLLINNSYAFLMLHNLWIIFLKILFN